ncbi:hypothetical protein H7698_13245 [Pseudomonas sp. p50]|nr:hypothetical protein [Pseudomonas sp. p50(2008)]
MKRFLKQLTGSALTKGLLLLIPVSYGTFLAWQEWLWRENLASVAHSVVAPIAAPSRENLDTTAVATVFGLVDEATRLPSAESLSLQASFVVASGVSRALLADAQGSRMYQVGEQLPGGSVLRRVEPNQVVLWNKGREELLTLQPSAERFLRRLESPSAPNAAAASSRFLRPFLGPSE